jgi:hypothetical protein
MAGLSFADNTYFLSPQITEAAITDRLKVEVGDSKQPSTFYPQTKFMRWDNEVNLSVRLVDPAPLESATITMKDGLISWEKSKVKAQYYEQPVCEEYPEGGYEFEIILKQKPKSNTIDFTLQTKGLDFIPQPALTEAEIKAGHFRPENVVDSCVAYHSTKRDYVLGQYNYNSGKAFHIYRIKVTDAIGKSIWATFNVDATTNILRVTVDQKFLDTAVYPVVVDPTIGYTTGGGSFTTVNPDEAYGSLFTSPSSAASAPVASMSHYGKAEASRNVPVKPFICLHSTLEIISNGVAARADHYGSTPGWMTSTFSPFPVFSSSIDYLLMTVPDLNPPTTNYFYLGYDAGDANQGHYDETNSYDTPENLGAADHNNNKYSIYATYNYYQYDTSARGTGASNPQTLSYTCGASAKLLVLGIVTAGGTIRAGGAPTYNGVAMTQVDANRSATETCCELWYLLNPDVSSAHDVSVPNTGTKTVYLLASSYKPVTAGNSFAYDTANGAVETSANPDVTVTTTVNNDVVVAVLGDGLDTKPTAQSYELLFSTDDGAYSDNLQYTIQEAAGNVTMSWTVASDDWCMCVGAWKEVGGGHPSIKRFGGIPFATRNLGVW